MKIRHRLGNLLKMCKFHLIIICITEELGFLVSYHCCSLCCCSIQEIQAIKYCTRYFMFITEGYLCFRGASNVVVRHLRDSRYVGIERVVQGNSQMQPFSLQKYQPMCQQKEHIITPDSFFLIFDLENHKNELL